MSATEPDPTLEATRVLAVVDWNVDPRHVVAALRAESDRSPTAFTLLVPARLPGVDWVGDPNASRPCAERQLLSLWRLADREGLVVERGGVGAPERVAEIRSWIEARGADRVLLFDDGRRAARHPLSVEARLRRSTGLDVARIVAPSAAAARHRFPHRAPRCAPLTLAGRPG